MKKIFLLVFVLILSLNVHALMYSQTKTFTGTSTATTPHSLTFNEYSHGYTLERVEVIFYLKSENGQVKADNDDLNSTATYDFQLGGSGTMTTVNVGTSKPLSNAAFGMPWLGQAANGSSGSLAVEPAFGQPGHDTTPVDILDGTPDDGAQYDGLTETITVTDDINSGAISQFSGTSTFNYGVIVIALNNINASGGQVDGGFTAADLSGYVTVNYYDDNNVPVELSTFTALFMNGTPTLQWVTHSESNNMGWNVYRAESDEFDTAMQVNYEIIAGAGTTSQSTNYEYEDEYPVIQGRTYFYWIESVDLDGTTTMHDPAQLSIPTEENNQQSPDITKLEKFYNYPNPMNPDTWIYFETERPGKGDLTIYNIKGEKVCQLHKGSINEGVNKFYWDGKDKFGRGVKSGVYLYVLDVDSRTYTQKMVLVK